MTDESPYIFERGPGLVHIRLRSNPKSCLADIRTDAYDIAYTAAYADGYRAGVAAREAAEKAR